MNEERMRELSLPINIKPFRMRTEEGWASFLAGEGELHDETVDFGIVVQAVYLLKQALFCHVVLEAYERRCKATLPAGFHFVGNVCLAPAIVSHEYGGEVRAPFACGYHFLYFGSDFQFYFGCYFLSVNKLHPVSVIG